MGKLGFKHSEETKKKMRKKRALQIITSETRKKISDALKGRIFSEEWKNKISLSNKGENNAMYGKHHSEETRRKMSESGKNKPPMSEESRKKLREKRMENDNPNWKGNKVGYTALHNWIKRRLIKPKKCQDCNKKPTSKRGLDLANISQEYRRDISDWEWLCRRCHMTKDGRTKNRSIKGTFIKRIKVCMIQL